MSSTHIVVVGVVAVVGVCLFAVIKGAAPERSAAIWVMMTWLSTIVAETFFGRQDIPLIVLCADGVLATALLFISIQYASLWLGGAMLVQASAFALHAWFLTEEPTDRNIYLLAVSLLSYTVLVLLMGATISRWRARVIRARRGPARRSRVTATPVLA